jgi:hypothetical protein
MPTETEENKFLKEHDLGLVHYEIISCRERDDNKCDRIIRNQAQLLINKNKFCYG